MIEIDVCIIDLPYPKGKAEKAFLLSDAHMESKHFNRAAFHKDLRAAANDDCRILLGGDISSLIVPSDLKRWVNSKNSFDEDAILNETTDFVYEQLRDYVDHLYFMGWGNHEEEFLKRHYYNLVRSVVARLNAKRSKSLQPIHMGGYRGFIRFKFSRNGGSVRTLDIFRHHLKGGGADVTKGMIDLQRLRAEFRADLYWGEHKHKSIDDDSMKETGLNSRGQVYQKRQAATITGTYEAGEVRNADLQKTGAQVEYGDRFYSTPTNAAALLEMAPTARRMDVPFRVIKNPFFRR